MKFGGHQTFAIRDGWLYKGLELLMDETQSWKLTDEYALDYLGVGRNMAKAINHWLVATGLAKKKTVKNDKTGKTKEIKDLEPTKLADIIWANDPYFLDTNTWWFIHINLVHNKEFAATWNWFFNYFSFDRFQKEKAVHNLERHLRINAPKTPSNNTLDRDVSCFLSTYSIDVPSRKRDPEDDIDCPLSELGLMKSYRNSGYFEVNRGRKKINAEVFLYALSKSIELDDSTSLNDIPFFDLINLESGPSKVFLLNNEEIFELIMELEAESNELKIHGMAGERLIQFENLLPLEWLNKYYIEAAKEV